MITGWSISKACGLVSMMVCTPEPGMLNWIRFVVFGGGGLLFESKMAWRSEPAPPSLVLVTVKVIAGLGAGAASDDFITRSPAPGPFGCDFSHRFWPNPTTARETLVKQHATPIKTCRLKKADCVRGFFFIKRIFTLARARSP